MQRRTSLCFAHDRPNRTCAGSRTANLPPTISITAPANNAAFTAPATVHVSVNAADSDGTVTQVQYYDGVPPGAHLLGTLTTAPFSTDLLAQVAGDYTVVAVATDNSGAQTSSSILSFTVNGSAGAAQVFYIHTDQLDTPRLITNSNNSAVWRWDNFDAFGDNPPNDDPSATGLHFIYNPRFAGQYFDKETRLNYNYFRDYDTGTGRSVESDPIGLAGRSYSTYSYVNGSPLMYLDPMGEMGLFRPIVAFCEKNPVACSAAARAAAKKAKDLCKAEEPPPPDGVPDDWIQAPSDKGGGTKYTNPNNPHDSVRDMPGNPDSPNPAQQDPYVVRMKDGSAIDANGNPVSPKSPEAHIPREDFKFKP